MKTVYRLFAVLACGAVLASCDGFLDENPKTQMSEATAFANEASVTANMIGCYRALCGDAMITGNMNECLDCASGLLIWCYGSTRLTDAQERWACQHNFTQYSKNPCNYNEFKGFYTVINRCNKLIEQLPSANVSSAFKTQIDGEAHFLRALAYYYLVRQWGDVPVYLKSPKTMAEANSPRVDFWKVYKIVVDDFTTAAAEMPSEWSVDRTVAGRPISWAAKAMLAQVYVTVGTLLLHHTDNFWTAEREAEIDFSGIGVGTGPGDVFTQGPTDAFTKALAYAEDVIENSPYELAPNFAALFRWTDPADWQLKERIMVIPNCSEVSTSNYTAIRSLPDFPEGTKNKVSKNSNSGRWKPCRFTFQKWAERYGASKGPDSVNKGIYMAPPDPRFDVTIWHSKIKNQNTNKYIYPYPHNSYITYSISKNGEAFFKKYLDPNYDANSGYADFYLMRFAEVYLLAAEAAANLSTAQGDANWDKAIAYVNVILKRARTKPDGSMAAEPADWTTAYFNDFPAKNEIGRNATEGAWDPHQGLIDAIFWERMFEMLAEGHEYFDTHRMGAKWLADNIAAPKNRFLQKKEQQLNAISSAATPNIAGYTGRLFGSLTFAYPTDPEVLRKSMIVAFPNDEIVNNQNISYDDQNPFWWR